MNLILVRHGETDWNSERRYQGQLDIPLNGRGQWQALQVGEALAGLPAELLISSDLQRAYATAAAIATSCGLSVTTDPRLRELSFGIWEGLTYSEIQDRHAESYRQWKQDPDAHPPPGGEAMDAAVRRVAAAWQEIKARNAQTVVLVAHGGALRVLLRHLLRLPSEAFWQGRLDNGSLSEVCITPAGAELIRLNDIQHLQAAQARDSAPKGVDNNDA